MYKPYDESSYNRSDTDIKTEKTENTDAQTSISEQESKASQPASPSTSENTTYTSRESSAYGAYSYSSQSQRVSPYAENAYPHSPYATNTPPAQTTSQGVPVGTPYTPGAVRHDASAQQPAAPRYPYTASAPSGTPSPQSSYGVPSYTSSYGPYSNQPAQSAPSAPAQATEYTWSPRSASSMPYYGAVQPPKRKKSRKGGKFFLRLTAAVLACAVVSLGSVGIFAMMIQNGTVNIESTGSAETAAFTIYKLEDGENDVSTVTGSGLTATEVAEKLIPSVVCVQNYQIRQNSFEFFFGEFGYSESDTSEVDPAGEGSGIIISEDGYIVTNQHVIDSATSLKVVTSDGLTYEAKLVGEDTQTDLAVIKIESETPFTPAEFGSAEDLKVAEEVMAIGNPGGLQLNSSVTMGYVSALDRQITTSDTGYTIECIQTDAAINPGNSGGALVNMQGHVVGINSSKIVATGYEGLGFAIPSDTVQPIVSDLIEFGYVKDRPSAGFFGQYIDYMTARFYGLTQGYFVDVVSSEAAADSGLQRGDVITAIDGTQITADTTITTYIADKKPGDMVILTVDRAATGESDLKIELTLSENTGISN